MGNSNKKEIIDKKPKCLIHEPHHDRHNLFQSIFMVTDKIMVFNVVYEYNDCKNYVIWDISNNKKLREIKLPHHILGVIKTNIVWFSKEEMIFHFIDVEKNTTLRYYLPYFENEKPIKIFHIRDNIVGLFTPLDLIIYDLNLSTKIKKFEKIIFERNCVRIWHRFHLVHRGSFQIVKPFLINKYLFGIGFVNTTIIDNRNFQIVCIIHNSCYYRIHELYWMYHQIYFIDLDSGAVSNQVKRKKENTKVFYPNLFDSDWIFELYNLETIKAIDSKDNFFIIKSYKKGEFVISTYISSYTIYNGKTAEEIYTLRTDLDIYEMTINQDIIIERTNIGYNRRNIRIFAIDKTYSH